MLQTLLAVGVLIVLVGISALVGYAIGRSKTRNEYKADDTFEVETDE